jgi:S1-C subfamily serine protease
MRTRPIRTLLVLPLAAVALAGCSGSSGGATGTSSPSPSPSASTTTAGGSVTQAVQPPGREVCHGRTVPQVVRDIEPSVVTVRTQKGLGSGIVYRKDTVLTDQHVVAVQEGQPAVVPTVELSLADGSTIKGTVTGSDLLTDLAVIHVSGKALPPLTFRSALPQPGETVLAIGSPLGFNSSVTEGIVSAIGRNLPAAQSSLPLVDLIQTDAAISPGNSGGALVDVCGQVVGINEAYIPPQSGAVSLGFATPAVVATNIADQLIKNGTAQHPFLGIRLTNLTPAIASALGTGVRSGVVVVDVLAGGPAAKAGIRRGDVITRLGGHAVASYADLLGTLRTTTPGNDLQVTVDRDGKKKQLTVTVGSRKAG